MAQKFLEKGYEVTEHTEKADIYIINTCTVTNMSDRKSRQMLRRVRDLSKEAIIVACGCYVQVGEEELKKIDEIDLILGNNEKKDIVEHVEKYIETHQKDTKVDDVMYKKDFVEFGDITYTEKTRAVIKIQDGCDRFCSYCIIPYARGRVRSRNPKNIISEINKIAQKGIKEIVITGIHIASYGKDFDNKYKLIDLLEEINKIKGIERIRLGSIEPLLITEEFLLRLVKLEKICEHFHLSLQSGCDETLKRMNRRYTTRQFRDIVELLRKYYKNVILTTDIIVGFPQESKEEFTITYNFLKEIKFYKMHVFKYSPRKGTKAAQMTGQIDGKIKEERSQKLIELSNINQKTYNVQYVGKKVDVLFEEQKDGIYKGHTKNYILIHCNDIKNDLNNNKRTSNTSNKEIENQILTVKCIKAHEEYIEAELQ